MSDSGDDLLFSPELKKKIHLSQTLSDASCSQMSQQNLSLESQSHNESCNSTFLTQDTSELNICSQNNTSAIDIKEDLQNDNQEIKTEPKSDEDVF